MSGNYGGDAFSDKRSVESRKRREIVKKLIVDRGITSKAEILRVLESEFGLKVSRDTLYRDFKHGSMIDESVLQRVELDITSTFREFIAGLKELVDKAESPHDKIAAMKACSQIIKDRQTVLNNIAMRGRAVASASGKGDKSDVKSIVFGEPKVAKVKKKDVSDVW